MRVELSSPERLALPLPSYKQATGGILDTCSGLRRCMRIASGWANGPNTKFMTASTAVCKPGVYAPNGDECGGIWVYPKRFSKLPTPPGAKDKSGRPLPTNVAPGEVCAQGWVVWSRLGFRLILTRQRRLARESSFGCTAAATSARPHTSTSRSSATSSLRPPDRLSSSPRGPQRGRSRGLTRSRSWCAATARW